MVVTDNCTAVLLCGDIRQSILWENILPARKKAWAYFARFVTLGVTVAVLLISFALIYRAKTAKAEAGLKYPNVNCDGCVRGRHFRCLILSHRKGQTQR
jgi:hypothetical protein